ncbi:phage holin family protein [Candidatus Saccharibacteria bacterium]|nr:phage holin family protein [Candidatus Saccharibacteria bacterium]MCB9834939.1 phage holin family protein [Candidatus Nomurabacteria bacterium]
MILKRILFSTLINFLGLTVAANLIDGINYQDNYRVLIIASLVFGFVNALIRPVIIILSLPAILATFGLFTFVVNGLMLYLTSIFYGSFEIANFRSAILAGFLIWVINYLMTDLVKTNMEKGARG